MQDLILDRWLCLSEILLQHHVQRRPFIETEQEGDFTLHI